MKIYNADSIQPEQEFTYEQQLEHCFAQAKQLLDIYKKKNTETSRMYSVIEEFIQRNDDLFDRYVTFLNELKHNPEWSEYQNEIEYMLSEFGADDESERWFEDQMKKDGVW